MLDFYTWHSFLLSISSTLYMFIPLVILRLLSYFSFYVTDLAATYRCSFLFSIFFVEGLPLKMYEFYFTYHIFSLCMFTTFHILIPPVIFLLLFFFILHHTSCCYLPWFPASFHLSLLYFPATCHISIEPIPLKLLDFFY